jgi:metal-responsive CopG/Arc/MetJ family transcriptional regulator
LPLWQSICCTLCINFIEDEKVILVVSEVKRGAIKAYLSEYEISKFEIGNLTATNTVLYQKSGSPIDDVISHLRHEYGDIVEGNLHLHVEDGNNYEEIFVTEGNVERYQIL